MRTRVFVALLASVLFVALAVPVASFAADQRVMSVIGVKVTGDRQAYLKKVGALQGIQKRLGVPATHIWRATLAGSGTDLVYIVAEYASLAAYADATGKLTADPEAAKLLRELDASGVRTVVDRSLFVEETP